MITLKALLALTVLISGMMFAPSYSFAQSDNANPFDSFFEIFRQIFSFSSEPSSPVQEFDKAAVIQTSGTSSTTDTTENNLPPMADAGPNQVVNEFANVTLNGTSSIDPDGTIVSYNWSQISGPQNVTLSNNNTAIATFNAPSVNGTEIFEFLLSVMDNSNATDTDTVKITIKENGPENLPPMADAGPNQVVMEFANVILNGTSSTDPDGTIVSYNWSQISGPSVTLNNNNTAIASFEAPGVDGQKILEFLLSITDNSNATDTDTIKVTVNDKDDPSDEREIEIEAEVEDGQTKIKVEIDDEEFYFKFDEELTDEEIIDFISNEFDLDPDFVEEIIEIERENNDDQKDEYDKVEVCHIPPGNPDNAHTISIGASAVDAHLRHGDILGECPEDLQLEYENEKQDREDQREREKQDREDQREREKQDREDQREREKQDREDQREREKQDRKTESELAKSDDDKDDDDKDDDDKDDDDKDDDDKDDDDN